MMNLLPFSLSFKLPGLLGKILPWLNRFGIIRLLAGKSTSMAMHLMSVIVDARDSGNTKNLVKEIYPLLPTAWTSPEGPATEKELQEAVKKGIEFARAAKALAKQG